MKVLVSSTKINTELDKLLVRYIRDEVRESVAKLAKFYKSVPAYLQKPVPVYRGLRTSIDVLDSFIRRRGMRLSFRNVSSWSTNLEEALNFSTGIRYMEVGVVIRELKPRVFINLSEIVRTKSGSAELVAAIKDYGQSEVLVWHDAPKVLVAQPDIGSLTLNKNNYDYCNKEMGWSLPKVPKGKNKAVIFFTPKPRVYRFDY